MAINPDIIQEEYPYWDKLQISYTDLNNNPENIPYFLQAYAYEVQKIIEQEKNPRICLIIPDRSDVAFWLSILLSFPMIKKHFDPTIADRYHYPNGQYCLYKNQYIVQFFNVDQHHMAYKINQTRKRGRKTVSIPLKKTMLRKNMIEFQPILGEHTITEWEDFKLTYRRKSRNQLDKILGISSFGNTMCYNAQLLLVSSKTEIFNIIKNHKINKISPAKLFDWQYISSHKLQCIGTKIEKLFGPTIFLSAKLPLIAPILEHANSTIRMVIVDGAYKMKMELGVVDDLIRKGLPVLCVSDPRDHDYFQFLQERNFHFLQPDCRTMLEAQYKSEIPSFIKLNQSIKTHINKSYKIIDCQSETIESILQNYYSLKRLAKEQDRNHPITTIIRKISVLTKVISQSIHVASEASAIEMQKNIEEIRLFLVDNLHFFSKDLESTIRNALDEIESSLLEGKNIAPDSKFDHFQQELGNLASQSVCILSMTPSVDLAHYWQAIAKTKKTIFKQYDEFMQNPNFDYDQLWIMGFNNKKKLRDLMTLSKAGLVLFFYKYEKSYFNSSVKKWWNKYYTSQDYKSNILGTSQAPRKIDQTHKIPTHGLAKERIHSERPSSKPLAHATLIQIEFSGNYQLICSSTHRLYTVTDALINKDFSNIPRYLPAQLNMEDHILFRTTGTDIIREWVDHGLAKTGQMKLRKTAESWKQPLLSYVEKRQKVGLNRSDVYRFFQKKGLKRSYVAFSSWLDPERIGPQNNADLELILRVTGEKVLLKEINKIFGAIKRVRAKHKKAWHTIQNVLNEEMMPFIPKLLQAGDGVIGPVALPRVGEIIILKVQNIEEYPEIINPSLLNRLRSKEAVDESHISKSVELEYLFSLEDRLFKMVDAMHVA